MRARDRKKLQRNDLLLPAEIERALDTSHSPRDKALIAVLWETGGRIAEVGNLQLKHLTRTDVGYTLDVTGKTGQRTPLIVSSAPYLTQWLNNHPFRTDAESPVWVHYQYGSTPRQMQYATIRGMLLDTFRRAGVTKRVYPHLFRHSRATYVLASGLMTEAQAKAYFGWTPASEQLATYAHLLASDANAAILREQPRRPKKDRGRAQGSRVLPLPRAERADERLLHDVQRRPQPPQGVRAPAAARPEGGPLREHVQAARRERTRRRSSQRRP